MSEVEVVREVSPAVGVEIRVDGSVDLTPAGRSVLQELFDRYHLLLLRDRALSYEEQRTLVGQLGPLLASERTRVVSNVAEGGVFGTSELVWHSDHAFTTQPRPGASLYGVDVGYEVTSTRFANAVRACAQLPVSLRQRVSGLRAVHLNNPDKEHYRDPARRRATHPVILEHPRTGVPILYVSEGQTAEIVGLGELEGLELLEDLLAHLYHPDNVYEHWWRARDLVIWDNFALQHARNVAPVSLPRTLERVVLGERDLVETPEY